MATAVTTVAIVTASDLDVRRTFSRIFSDERIFSEIEVKSIAKE